MTTRRIAHFLKRGVDITVAAGALAATWPVTAGTACAILLSMGRPVLFRQQRPGKDGVPFEVIKFRTMRTGAASDSDRLTRLGRLLRASSLDELPTLWNVVRGDMSLVGPRPLLMQYLALYDETQSRRHKVRPGITGWAQVHGRNDLRHEDKFRLDVWYVDNWSLRLDTKVLLKTIAKVVAKDGVNAPGHATMPVWTGNQDSAA